MTSTLILTILFVFSYLVGSFLKRFQTPNFAFSGMIYLLFGMFLGSKLGINFLSTELITKLEPLTSLLIGIAGYLLGLRIKMLLKNSRILITGLLSASLVFITVSAAFFLVSPILLPEQLFKIQFIPLQFLGNTYFPEVTINQLWFCAGIGATACSASLMNLGAASRGSTQTDSEIYNVLALMTKAVQCLAIIIIGACLAMARSAQLADQFHITIFQWFIAAIFSGVVCGLLFSLFIGRQSNPDRIMLAALGTIIFASGIGIILGVSSLFVAFTTGATISLVSSYEEILREHLSKLEEPIFVMLLVIGGAGWEPELSYIWFLPLLYFVVRFVVFAFVPQIIYRQLQGKQLTRLGQGLLGQDLMAVALAVSFAQQFPSIAQMFLTTVLGSIFLNDLLASRLLKKVILDNELKTTLQVLEPEKGSS